MNPELRWRSGLTGSWFASTNWVADVVPATGDTAIIDSGTAQILSPSSPLVGIHIVLGGVDGSPPAILEAIDAVFEGSSGTPEINVTLTVSGLPALTNAVFIAEGETSFDGQIFVEAVAGSLTILVRDDGDGSALTLLNTDQKAAIVVSQESFLDFEGQTVVNESLIQIEGGVEISAGVSFTGTKGVFVLENGGQLLVEGEVAHTQQIVFVDGTGKLTIENLAGFHGVIDYAELPPQPGQPPLGIAGGRIELTQVAAQSLAFQAGSGDTGTLTLYAGPNQTGAVVAELTMGMVNDVVTPAELTLTSADFSLSSNGNGGTLITYSPQGSTFLLGSLPTPVIAHAGDVVSLKSILQDSFGKSDTPFKGVWLFPSKPFENTSTNVGYWNPPNDPDPQSVTPQWYVRGKPVETATFVKDISKVTLQAGNQIDSPASFQLRITDAKSGTDAEFVAYNVWTVDPAIVQAMQMEGFVPGTVFTPEMVVKAAEAFAKVYGDGAIPNTNLCDWIADNVAAGAGATMPFPNASFDPSLNVEGGFWRIFYASDIPNPVQDWSGLVQPGDIVRMGWFKPESGRVSGHTTTVLSLPDPGTNEIQFYDNNDSQHIGIHDAAYWLNTDPDDITIYRLDPNQQYLIEGTSLSEEIWGSVHNNLIRPGGGADVVRAKLGDNEIEGAARELDGIDVRDFDFGDSFHFTDLDASATSATWQHGALHVFEGSNEVAAIKLPHPARGLAFIVTADPDGGASVALAPRQHGVAAGDPDAAARADSEILSARPLANDFDLV